MPDVCLGADRQAQARALCGRVLETVHAGDLWSQDRHFDPCAFLGGIAQRDAWCMTRQHAGRPYESVRPFRAAGRVATGRGAEQRVGVRAAQGTAHSLRRIRVTFVPPTRDGESVLSLWTKRPPHTAAAPRVARCYRNRWPRETACQRLEAPCHAAIHPLGYPQAAFLGCCLALVASHPLAVVLAAFRGVPGEERMERDSSR